MVKVYVGGLPYGVRERDLEKFFKGYGRLRDVILKNGFGFVEFEDYRDADDAVYELNGKSLLGERVTVEIAKGIDRSLERNRGGRYNSYRPPPPRRNWGGRDDRDDRFGPPTRSDHRLIVENLSSRVSWQDLKDFMRQVGEVCYADAHKRHRNEGVVEFESYTEMKKALEKLDGAELNGRRIRLIEDKPRGRGGRSRSSSSRSRSRSRSRSSKSRSRTRSKSGSRSRKSKSKGKSASRSPSKSRKRSRSRTRSESKGRKVARGSGSPEQKRASSRSRSRSARSRSRTPHSRSRSASRHNSRSPAPEQNGNGEEKSPARSDNE